MDISTFAGTYPFVLRRRRIFHNLQNRIITIFRHLWNIHLRRVSACRVNSNSLAFLPPRLERRSRNKASLIVRQGEKINGYTIGSYTEIFFGYLHG